MKSIYVDAFCNGHEFRCDNWTQYKRLWINPTWDFLPTAVVKLCKERPESWIFVAPVPRTNEPWFECLSALCGVESALLPKSHCTLGYFQRYRPNEEIEDLPHPEWQVIVFKGCSASFSLTAPEELEAMNTAVSNPINITHTADRV